jgi:hypothetical protein
MHVTAEVAEKLPVRIRVCLQACRKSLKICSASAAAASTSRVKLSFSATSAVVLSKTALGLMLIAGLIGSAEATTQKVCTETEIKEAQKEADQLSDWDSVYRSFKRFANCDEGGIAEAYSDSVGRLLARDWKHVDVLVRLTSDPAFEDFVIRHIDETMSEDEAALVINNARLHCPHGARRLCRSIADY